MMIRAPGTIHAAFNVYTSGNIREAAFFIGIPNNTEALRDYETVLRELREGFRGLWGAKVGDFYAACTSVAEPYLCVVRVHLSMVPNPIPLEDAVEAVRGIVFRAGVQAFPVNVRYESAEGKRVRLWLVAAGVAAVGAWALAGRKERR